MLVVTSWEEEPDAKSILLNCKLLTTALWKSIYKHTDVQSWTYYFRGTEETKIRNYVDK